jgi:uncharacterized protein involved in type VI secretion and phage assembly
MKHDPLAVVGMAVPMHALTGAHLARVTDVKDPDKQARVKVELYSFDTDTGVALWARVASPFAGDSCGGFFIPDVDDEVLVVFVGGDPRAPVVIGGLWNHSARPPESLSSKVDRWSITGKAGTRIAIVEESASKAKVDIQTPGGTHLVLTDESGGKVTIECAGNTVTIDSQGVAVQAAAKVKVTAGQVEVSAGMVKVDAGMSKFSGVVKCDVLIANSVVSSSYTPGAGNIW